MQANVYAGFWQALRGQPQRSPIIEAALSAGQARVIDLARLSKAPIAAEAVKRIDVLFATELEINGFTA
ncbi:hypothetical protein [Bradyrhizobium diazoefficiens]|uniref:Uncharacterized protein n=1 Tax=Bradyrhizobium diazoefficiens TaxID=1355477 RepID=A0A810BMP0_9BRAD|nr:hypothetical protein [Bradyrhizobium diazoefficiens]WLC15664.1 hypothetical protein QIH76_37010 [Bradyrhizobium diazoefficiens]BCA07785.1 hypothetical protein H12S4_86890 [Bradyrhizobium diazoefficiens]BCA25138.1 hypothetical protein BDHH15_83530 [Bradyrhizobium diazoefficiens]BCE43286.1 hypothetical protein XF3B_83170 [Bradyrhizobium diazoefficiens]BCE78208.1 hypothetical protein XF8B_83190 [Bradyrhizobium diazoefficiens]